MHLIKLKFYVNPLGHLIVDWRIPLPLFPPDAQVEIEIPGFKYDLPKFAGIPVPFSSKAIPLKIENITTSKNLETEVSHKKDGNKILKLSIINKTKTESEIVKLKYEIKDIVNSDGIFFVVVYPFINPFNNDILFDIGLQAKFSFKIRRFKFREWYFNKNTGEKIKKKDRFKTMKKGDLISLSAKSLPLSNYEELDIHLTGTRLWVMIRRDIFWMTIFIISLVIILSPLWSNFI